jgi:hypothetical protein
MAGRHTLRDFRDGQRGLAQFPRDRAARRASEGDERVRHRVTFRLRMETPRDVPRWPDVALTAPVVAIGLPHTAENRRVGRGNQSSQASHRP